MLAEQGSYYTPRRKKPNPPNDRSPLVPGKLCRPRPYTYNTNEDCPMVVALFNTTDQESSDSSSDDATVSPSPSLLALCVVLGTPLPRASPSPRAVWQALGFKPVTADSQQLRGKEALSPACQPF